MILAVALGVQLATTFHPSPPDTTDAAALAERYGRECGGGKGGEACRALGARVERALYDHLRALYGQGGAADRETLRTAAQAAYAPLAAFALRRLGDDLRPEDAAVVIGALDSPYALVRDTAIPLLLRLPEERAVRLYRRAAATPADPDDPGIVADVVPDAARLGVPLPADARFRFFASGSGRAVFTTGGAPDEVLRLYGDAPVLSPAEATERLAPPPHPAALARRWLDAGGTRGMLKAGLRRRTRLRAWIDAVVAEDGVRAPRVVLLGDDVRDAPAPRTVVVVFRDDVLGTTALAVPTPHPRRARRPETDPARPAQ